MPYASQPPRGVCDDCRRGVRADRLEGGRCFGCRADRATAGLALAEALRARRQLEAREWQREAELQRGSPRLYCPRCRRQRVRQWLSDHPLCMGCEVQLALEDMHAAEARGPRRAVAAAAEAPRRRSLSERAGAWFWGTS